MEVRRRFSTCWPEWRRNVDRIELISLQWSLRTKHKRKWKFRCFLLQIQKSKKENSFQRSSFQTSLLTTSLPPGTYSIYIFFNISFTPCFYIFYIYERKDRHVSLFFNTPMNFKLTILDKVTASWRWQASRI
jgi:hypothetical protein